MVATVKTKILDDLPVVVDGPGNYRTRDGRLVIVCAVTKLGAFRAKGTIFSPPKLGKVNGRNRYDIWHVSGRALPVNEVSYDIVSKDN